MELATLRNKRFMKSVLLGRTDVPNGWEAKVKVFKQEGEATNYLVLATHLLVWISRAFAPWDFSG